LQRLAGGGHRRALDEREKPRRAIDNDSRRFSTAFNFGEHLALERTFGEDWRMEIALRLQYCSNGGIKQPNSGINFLQMRYSHRFR